MAGSTWGKRQREKAKREKKAARRARRDMKREDTGEPVEVDQAALMQRFAALNQALAEGRINQETFDEQRDEIWEAMGLPPAT